MESRISKQLQPPTSHSEERAMLRDEANKKLLPRIDPKFQEVILSGRMGTVYQGFLEPSEGDGLKTIGISGPVFLVKRIEDPFYAIILINSKGQDDIQLLLEPSLVFRDWHDLLVYSGNNNEFYGIWLQDNQRKEFISRVLEVQDKLPRTEDKNNYEKHEHRRTFSSILPVNIPLSPDVMFAGSKSGTPAKLQKSSPKQDFQRLEGVDLLSSSLNQQPTKAQKRLQSSQNVPSPRANHQSPASSSSSKSYKNSLMKDKTSQGADLNSIISAPLEQAVPTEDDPLSSWPPLESNSPTTALGPEDNGLGTRRTYFQTSNHYDEGEMPAKTESWRNDVHERQRDEYLVSFRAPQQLTGPWSQDHLQSFSTPEHERNKGPRDDREEGISGDALQPMKTTVATKASKLPSNLDDVRDLISPDLDSLISREAVGMTGKGNHIDPTGDPEPLDKGEFVMSVIELLQQKSSFTTSLYSKYLARFTAKLEKLERDT